MVNWLESLSLSLLVTGSGVNHSSAGRSGDSALQVTHDWTLALPHIIRQSLAEFVLHALVLSSHTPPLPPNVNSFTSDGSMVPTTPSFRHPCSVTFAAASSSSSLVCSLSSFRNATSILYAEVYGIIAATLQCRHTPNTPSLPLYTDHLNSVRIINDSISTSSPLLPHQWASLPARSLYWWLHQILLFNATQSPNITYTPAHTSQQTLPAVANAFIDFLASHSHHAPLPTPPVPIFTMDNYTLFSLRDGYIESNPSTYISHAHIATVVEDKSFQPLHCVALPLYNHHPPPEHPYTCASSAYFAVVQLYARCDQLDTHYLRSARLSDTSLWCHFGCSSLETPHHIFVQCLSFTSLCTATWQDVLMETTKLLDGAETT
ncbi:hypothetical protein BKA93DRAFT_822185 [Sparassis latifolia]